LGKRLGQFLQPAVVGESSIPNRRVWMKGNLQAGSFALLTSRAARCFPALLFQLNRSRGQSGSGENSIMHRLAPGLLKIIAAQFLLPPMVADDVIAAAHRL